VDETFRVMRRCAEDTPVALNYRGPPGGPNAPSVPEGQLTWGEPALREVRPGHWAACHYVDNFERSPATMPVLDHRRAVVPQAVEGDHLPDAAVVLGQEVGR
jgi:hypothetical protein